LEYKKGTHMKKIILSVLGVVLVATNLFAAKPETPKPDVSATFGAKYISVSDAKKAQDNGALILDTRKSSQVSEEKIKDAVKALYREKGGNKNRIPNFDSSKDKFTTKNIPTDKNVELITYCNGPRCWRSFKAAVSLTKMGYTNVSWMRDGIPAWKSAGLPTK
jgi:rhodanese-related sulfurtransferase